MPRLYSVELPSSWSNDSVHKHTVLLLARRKELFPAFPLQCLLPLPGPVAQAHREEPLCYAPVAAISKATLFLAWWYGEGSSSVDGCLPERRSGRLPTAAESLSVALAIGGVEHMKVLQVPKLLG